jgi:flavin-binding protein dodecin
MRWARVEEIEMELDGKKIVKYRVTAKTYFLISTFKNSGVGRERLPRPC